MAQYYGTIQGNRGAASRMGHKAGGMEGHVRGWNIGARVVMMWNEETQEDECIIWVTGGSNGHTSSHCLGTFTAKSLELIKKVGG